MKAFKLFFAIVFLAIATSANAQSDKLDRFKDHNLITSSIKVYGECGSCKNRIENALKLPGIKSANWDETDKFLTVQYNKKVISLDKIQALIASIGHDTNKFRANDAVYQQLPECCHYNRKP